MAEKIIWIARCKLRGMNQRVGLVYDDVTLQILGLRSVGSGIGTVTVKFSSLKEIVKTQRLAHKANDFDLIDLRTENLQLKGIPNKRNPDVWPGDLKITTTWGI